jgi:hypothetical protein
MQKLLSLSLLLLVLPLGACEEIFGSDGDDTKKDKVQVGQLLTFNTQAEKACEVALNRTGRVVAVTDRAIVVADTSNPKGSATDVFTEEDYLFFGREFDRLVWPVETRNFGEPADIDRNGKVVIFFTSAVNALTKGTESFVGGFFFARDLFPRTGTQALGACATSNEAELFYMRVPEPGRNAFSKNQVRQTTVGVLGHEFQHLINASRRLFVTKSTGENYNEVVWLNEGMSHIAEELLFYEETGLAPRQNITIQTLVSTERIRSAANTYQISNMARLNQYLEKTETSSPYDPGEEGSLATRGAIWQFLRYAADQKGGSDQELWRKLVDSNLVGMANLQASLGTDPALLFRSWAVANYTDDAGFTVDQRYTHPSWHYRSVLPAIRREGEKQYPLRTRQLASGAPQSFTLTGGGASYLRFGAASGIRAELRLTAGGQQPAGACQHTLNLQVGEVFNTDFNAGSFLCVAAAGEYTLVLFHGAVPQGRKDALEQLGVTVAANGVTPVLGPPNPSLGPSPFDVSVFTVTPSAGRDAEFEGRLREMEAEVVSRLVPGAGSARFSRAAVSGPAQLFVSLVRTK